MKKTTFVLLTVSYLCLMQNVVFADKGVEIQESPISKPLPILPNHDHDWDVSIDTSTIQRECQSEWVKNARQPLVVKRGSGTRINPNFSYVQEDVLHLNDLSYLIAKSQSKNDRLKILEAEYQKVVQDLHVLQQSKLPYLVQLDSLSDVRNSLEVKICQLKTELYENQKSELELRKRFTDSNWVLEIFKGKTGYKPQFGHEESSWVDDDRGLVAFDPKSGTFIVCYHGSRNGDDWKTNFDGMKVDATQTTLQLPRNTVVHRGFAYAAESCAESIKSIVTKILEVTQIDRENLNFYFTGHSQGAAVASIGMVDATSRLGKSLYGQSFNNAESNVFKGLFLSAPRAFAMESVDAVHAVTGKDNMVRQNVMHDPVPNASPRDAGRLKDVGEVADKVITVASTIARPFISVGKFIDKNTGLFTSLGKAISWVDSGIMGIINFIDKSSTLKKVLSYVPGAKTSATVYVAAHNTVAGTNAVTRILESDAAEPVRNTFADKTSEQAIDSMSGYAGVGHLALDHTGDVEKRAFWPSLKAWGSRVVTNTIGLFKSGTRFDNKPATVDDLIIFSAKDLVASIAAPLHYGSTINGGSGSFNPSIVGRDLNTMLNQGQEHIQSKVVQVKATVVEQPKSGFFSRMAEGVHSFFS